MVMSNMFATFLVASSIVAAATAKWVVPTKADVSGFSSIPGSGGVFVCLFQGSNSTSYFHTIRQHTAIVTPH
jgi:hypothetical protein